MNKKNFLLMALLVISSAAFSQKMQAAGNIKGALIWADEFNYKGLPDSTKWDYEEGYVRNKESQYYTRARLENCYVKKGNLVIESKKEEYKGAQYTSASINTLGKQSFSGDIRVDIRAKLPAGKGIWPALWMMGDNIKQVGWPRCVEFDIMEFVGHTPNTVHANLHWHDLLTGKHAAKGAQTIRTDLHSKYHVYGLERKGDKISVFIDDERYFTMSAPDSAFKHSFTNPLYLLINTAVGGEWGGEIDDKIFPQKYYIDFVRVYTLK